MTHAHTFLNTMIINWKSTLMNQIACLGVERIYQLDLPLAGRPAYHWMNWSAITQDQWVLNAVRGYQIDFVRMPHQRSLPAPPHYSSEQVTLIQEEVSKLLLKQVTLITKYPSISVEIPSVSVSGEGVPLHLSPLWPLIGPMGIHKDPEASSVNPAAPGCPDNRLHRRHLDSSKLLECLGLIINSEKSVLIPDQTIEFLGLTVNTNMELHLPPAKIKHIQA